ncbi:MAG: Gfo/Idh/MocA family oxidoreductase [Thermomicrobiales bacterium]|nr:Gfo/Idh/MocA family oxidoreductase [Thermomicrobiales bacterium]
MQAGTGHLEQNGPIRVGVIGAGFSGSLHLAALRVLPEFATVAVCTRRPERAAAVALELGIPAHTADFRELCRNPMVEGVIVATPPHLHHAMTIAALEAGKHVLCEKPMARNLAEARDMLRIAERAGTVAMIDYQQRYLPIRRKVKQLLDEGFIGEPHAVSVVVCRASLNDPYDRPWSWMSEQDKAGGMLGATGAHYIDALRWWFGDVKAVAGALSTQVSQRRLPDGSGMGKVDADDNFAVLLRFASGTLGSIHLSATSGFDGDEEVTISGSRGMLLVRGGMLLAGRVGDADLREIPTPESTDDDLPVFEHYLVAPTAQLLRSWGDAIASGDTASPSFADGVKDREILDAAARSGQQGRWIDTSGQRWPMGGLG